MKIAILYTTESINVADINDMAWQLVDHEQGQDHNDCYVYTRGHRVRSTNRQWYFISDTKLHKAYENDLYEYCTWHDVPLVEEGTPIYLSGRGISDVYTQLGNITGPVREKYESALD